jgi:hypothetical protein
MSIDIKAFERKTSILNGIFTSRDEQKNEVMATNRTEDPTGPFNVGPRRSRVDGAGAPSILEIT